MCVNRAREEDESGLRRDAVRRVEWDYHGRVYHRLDRNLDVSLFVCGSRAFLGELSLSGKVRRGVCRDVRSEQLRLAICVRGDAVTTYVWVGQERICSDIDGRRVNEWLRKL